MDNDVDTDEEILYKSIRSNYSDLIDAALSINPNY
jgi:hypothetical protein